MKKISILAVIFYLASASSFADTCPPIHELKATLPPPAGWTYLLGPDQALESYHFSSAIHSLNGSFYYEQVICRYAVCPSFGCPAFTLLSTKTYEEPNEARAPWDSRSVLKYTLTCMPGDHNPHHCVFK